MIDRLDGVDSTCCGGGINSPCAAAPDSSLWSHDLGASDCRATRAIRGLTAVAPIIGNKAGGAGAYPPSPTVKSIFRGVCMIRGISDLQTITHHVNFIDTQRRPFFPYYIQIPDTISTFSYGIEPGSVHSASVAAIVGRSTAATTGRLDPDSTRAGNCLCVHQVNRLSLSRRPRHALIRFHFFGVLRQSLWRRNTCNP